MDWVTTRSSYLVFIIYSHPIATRWSVSKRRVFCFLVFAQAVPYTLRKQPLSRHPLSTPPASQGRVAIERMHDGPRKCSHPGAPASPEAQAAPQACSRGASRGLRGGVPQAHPRRSLRRTRKGKQRVLTLRRRHQEQPAGKYACHKVCRTVPTPMACGTPGYPGGR